MNRLNQIRQRHIGYLGNDRIIPRKISTNSDTPMTGSGDIAVDEAVKKINFLTQTPTLLINHTKEMLEKVINKPSKIVKGSGVNLSGSGNYEPNIDLEGSSGSGMLPGSGMMPGMMPGMLPGDMLRKKILKKMIKEKRAKVLKKFNGQSSSRDLGSEYKLNPKPLVGAGKSNQKGGFFFLLPLIIAAISSAAAAATTAVATVSAITVLGTTVGALGTAALTSAVGTAAGVGVKKLIDLAGKGGKGMKGMGIEESIVKGVKNVIDSTKLTLEDFPTKAKIILKEGFEALKKNPSEAGILALGKKLAPVAREVMIAKVNDKLPEGVEIKSPSKDLAGSGKFNKHFIKVFHHKLKK